MKLIRRLFLGDEPRGLDRYRLRRRLAIGGMGEVWLAQAPNGERVVVKTTLEGSDEMLLELCMADEIQNTAVLDHPAIPKMLDAGEHEGRRFMVLEHISGDSLWRLSRLAQAAGQRLPDGLILRLGAEIADALHHAHTRCDEAGRPLHLVHRDVTPENIMLTHRGEGRLIDFGVAHSVLNDRVTAPGSIYGKVAYNSPEQVLEGPVGAATDQYQLGVVLWELLAGHRLFSGGSMANIIHRIAYEAPYELEDFRADLPVAVTETIMRCLAFHPMDRHDDCAQLAFRMRRLAEVLDPTEGQAYASWRAGLLSHELEPEALPKAAELVGSPTIPRAA